MKERNTLTIIAGFLLAAGIISGGCSAPGNKNSIQMKKEFAKGTYGYDVAFFERKHIETIQLKDSLSGASIMLIPSYQGRVMTSSASGDEGKSFGWINHSLIDSGKISRQFNPFGGEERLWLGPEGGPFSIYFSKGDEQVFNNWRVPAELDTDTFRVTSLGKTSVRFTKDFTLVNASGAKMDIGVERSVKLLTRQEAGSALGLNLDDSLSFVAYESENSLINRGETTWNKKSGFLSLWMLSMFNPSEKGVVFIPFRKGSEKDFGKIVTDDYFGKVPADRLIIRDGIIYFKTDGKLRSKIGISPKRALPFCGSYDPLNHTLTLLWYSAPEKFLPYVNSKWGKQDDPLKGDAVNSYNDGPVDDGSIMGPFYEIESSSPAALLLKGEKLTHIQRIFHISGDEEKLGRITKKIFGITIKEISEVF